jgi:hypothetical protein
MITQNKSGLRVNYEPDVVLDTVDFNHSFIGMPLVGVEVKSWHKLQAEVLEHRGELLAPIADSCMGNSDIEGYSEYEFDISKRVLSEIKH